MTDQEILNALRTGRDFEKVQRKLYDRLNKRGMKHCSQELKKMERWMNKTDYQIVVDDAFIAFRKKVLSEGFALEINLEAVFIKFLKNKISNYVKKYSRTGKAKVLKKSLDINNLSNADRGVLTNHNNVLDELEIKHIYDCLELLDPICQIILKRNIFEGFNFVEIGKEMGMSYKKLLAKHKVCKADWFNLIKNRNQHGL